MRLRTRLPLVAVLLLASVGCDQATKHIATQSLRGSPTIRLAGDIFRLQYAENEGAFLSLGAQLPSRVRFWLFTVGVAILLVGFLVSALRGRDLSPRAVAGLALVAGGGASNWVDRVFGGGRVVDFMNLGVGPVRTGIFNVADLAILGGIALLMLTRRKTAPHAQETRLPG